MAYGLWLMAYGKNTTIQKYKMKKDAFGASFFMGNTAWAGSVEILFKNLN